jgi:hypothetical protein
VTPDNAAHLVSAGGPWVALLGVLLAGLHAIRSGQLVPRTTLDVLIAQYESRIAETARQAENRIDESREREQAWRSAYDVERRAGSLRDDQINQLTVLGETSVALLKALPSPRTPA